MDENIDNYMEKLGNKILEDEAKPQKKPKRWQCTICNKSYCYICSAVKHNIKKHEGKAKFKDLKEMNLNWGR